MYLFTKQFNERSAARIFLVISALCLILHFIFFRYSFPAVNVDEASFFSPAYSLATKGVFSSDVHKSFLPGADHYTYWMPPFYMLVLGGILKMFGATVINAKLCSLVFICISAYLISFITTDKFIRIVLGSLLLICPFILITSAFIRMEALSVLLITVTILAVRFEANSYVNGLLAGILLMTHPMLGACSAALGIVMLRRGIKPFLIFCAVTLVTFSPYLFYIFQNVQLFKVQMGLQLARKSNAHLSDLKPSYLLQSVPFAALALFCLFKIKSSAALKWFLVTGIVLTLLLVLKSNEFNYQVYLIPYVVASIGLFMNGQGRKWFARYAVPGSLYVFFALLLFFKGYKYHFVSDASYQEILTYLHTHRQWQNRSIFVSGNPDVSTYLIMEKQQVERRNAVATVKTSDWFAKYNYVIDVTDNTKSSEELPEQNNPDQKPWLNWQNRFSYTTANGTHSMQIFIR